MKKILIGMIATLLMIGTAVAVYTVHNMTWKTEVLEAFEVLWLSDLHFSGGNCYDEEIDCSQYHNTPEFPPEVFHWTEPPETYETMAYPGDYECHCYVIYNWGMTDLDLQLNIEGNENVEFTSQHGNIMTIPGDDESYFWIKMELPTDASPGMYETNIEFNRV